MLVLHKGNGMNQSIARENAMERICCCRNEPWDPSRQIWLHRAYFVELAGKQLNWGTRGATAALRRG